MEKYTLRTGYSFGFDIQKDLITTNLDEAEALKEAHFVYQKTERLQAVADSLNKKGIRGKKGYKFSPFSVFRILTKIDQVGLFEKDGEIQLSPVFHPIIDIGTYIKTIEIVARRSNARTRAARETFLKKIKAYACEAKEGKK
ncbi:MAG: recombinase family protein [Peptostreptococcaceae bacterium]|nr:recombinase family protein [Peptostreptococcaceae bacterium]